MIGGTIGKVLAGMGVLIGLYLVLTNPQGDSAAANAIGGQGVNVVKALQGR